MSGVIKDCPVCYEEFQPVNSVDDDGEWTGDLKQNCDCDLMSYDKIKDLEQENKRVRDLLEKRHEGGTQCLSVELPCKENGGRFYMTASAEKSEERVCEFLKDTMELFVEYMKEAAIKELDKKVEDLKKENKRLKDYMTQCISDGEIFYESDINTILTGC